MHSCENEDVIIYYNVFASLKMRDISAGGAIKFCILLVFRVGEWKLYLSYFSRSHLNVLLWSHYIIETTRHGLINHCQNRDIELISYWYKLGESARTCDSILHPTSVNSNLFIIKLKIFQVFCIYLSISMLSLETVASLALIWNPAISQARTFSTFTQLHRL